ncbi:MAG: M23 family metallopeptidase [Scytonema sp. PMC 1069.18]|nr:M23 family metallopeptidase [Scytonema sp. PMC 1069.18]MEC4887010.1 M23 family metallopeptidase [Scytonema sp. PMC 1070.18]
MTLRDRLLFLHILVASVLGVVSTAANPVLAQTTAASCQTPALERFLLHKVAPGETLESIAQRYNLTPATIITMNPTLKTSRITVGSKIQLPPYNGIVVEVPRGQTWREVAAKYKVRPDVLFEVNGCQKNPRVVFVPEVKESFNRQILATATTTPTPIKLAGYPLPQVTNVAVPYGWQSNPANGEVFFHSGIDLLAEQGTSVQAIGDGTVVFAQEQGSYGNLVIINHGGGLQSRYAHLDSIKVSADQKVNKGDVLGTVGTTGTPTINQPHLHFEVRSTSPLGWKAQDPRGYLQQ